MQKKALAALTLAVGGLLSAQAVLAQNSAIPRTEYGHPDFQGTYTFRTITPLVRPVYRGMIPMISIATKSGMNVWI